MVSVRKNYHFKNRCPQKISGYSHTNSPKNQNFKKMKKMPGDIIFYACVPKIKIRWCTVPEIWCSTDEWTDRWMDRRTDRWKEKVTYIGGCHI